jgi:predicted metal-dependent peptidase
MIAAQKMKGNGAGNMNRELEDLLHPKVDWRELLREFVTATCAGRDYSSWRRPNRRFLSQGITLPTMVSERVETVVIGCDTSGSISVAEHTRNISEADAILQQVMPSKIHVIYWDSRVAGHEVYDDTNRNAFASTTKPVGGGGTQISVMFEHIKKKLPTPPDVCIVFTDGYTPWPDAVPSYPTLFAITGGSRIVAPFGQTIHVED